MTLKTVSIVLVGGLIVFALGVWALQPPPPPKMDDREIANALIADTTECARLWPGPTSHEYVVCADEAVAKMRKAKARQ